MVVRFYFGSDVNLVWHEKEVESWSILKKENETSSILDLVWHAARVLARRVVSLLISTHTDKKTHPTVQPRRNRDKMDLLLPSLGVRGYRRPFAFRVHNVNIRRLHYFGGTAGQTGSRTSQSSSRNNKIPDFLVLVVLSKLVKRMSVGWAFCSPFTGQNKADHNFFFDVGTHTHTHTRPYTPYTHTHT